MIIPTFLIMGPSPLSIAAISSSSSYFFHPCNRIPIFSIDHDHYFSPIKILIAYYEQRLRTKALTLNRGAIRFTRNSPQSLAAAPLDCWGSTERKESEAQEQKKFRPTDGGRLFVGNLPYAITSSQLLDTFGEAGQVLSVEIIYNQMTDRSRGFAFISMASLEEAKEAIRLFDGSKIGGRIVKVNFPEVPRGGESEVKVSKVRNGFEGFVDTPHRMYAGNLSWNLTSEGLREVFSKQPGLISARVTYNKESGRSRGFGFVTFASSEHLKSAINAMNGEEVEGRPLRLEVATEKGFHASPITMDLHTGTESLSGIAP